jgi:hypothetical protein
MKVDRRKLEIAMANVCMNTADIQIKTAMPRPTINNVITGRSVRPATVGKIAKALNVPVENLIDMEGGK